MPKTWLEKFNAAQTHQVKPAPVDIAGMKKGEIMLIPTPKIIDAFIAKIPRGQSMDVKALRAKLAKKYRAEVTCPITTGFHLRAVAEVALEKLRAARNCRRSPRSGACWTRTRQRRRGFPAVWRL